MDHHHDAIKDDAPRLAGAEGIRGQEQNDSPDFDSSDAQRKTLVTLTAKLAIAGYSLYPLGDGGYLACRWGQSRAIADLYGVQRFLRQVAGGAV
jgi:hypothetical protein